jgi:CRISPR-associated protein Cas1
MQLYLDSFGAFLAVRNGMFAVRTRANGERTFALRNLNAILLTKGTSLSADAALLAVENDIPVLLLDANTHFPLAQVSGGRPGSISTIRKNQLTFSRSPDGFAWAAAQIARKAERQRLLLQHLAETAAAPFGFADDVRFAARVIAPLEKTFANWQPPSSGNWTAADMEATANQFRGQEGTASRIYFQQLVKYLGEHVEGFDGRQKRPAYDYFNALLNYLYGMLYTSVHLALLKSGLDPYIGVLHADQYGAAPTLVFDAIEPYRPWADEVAIRLAVNGLATETAFEPDPDEHGWWLNAEGKSAVIDAMLAYLNTSDPYEGRNVRRSAQIDLDAQKLAVFLKDFGN